jgi:hypothetical protein
MPQHPIIGVPQLQPPCAAAASVEFEEAGPDEQLDAAASAWL